MATLAQVAAPPWEPRGVIKGDERGQDRQRQSKARGGRNGKEGEGGRSEGGGGEGGEEEEEGGPASAPFKTRT